VTVGLTFLQVSVLIKNVFMPQRPTGWAMMIALCFRSVCACMPTGHGSGALSDRLALLNSPVDAFLLLEVTTNAVDCL